MEEQLKISIGLSSEQSTNLINGNICNLLSPESFTIDISSIRASSTLVVDDHPTSVPRSGRLHDTSSFRL
jgi:hypothetical protein